MSKDEVKGKLIKEEGKIRVAAGKATGNTDQIIKGEAEKVKGKIQEDIGKAKRTLTKNKTSCPTLRLPK